MNWKERENVYIANCKHEVAILKQAIKIAKDESVSNIIRSHAVDTISDSIANLCEYGLSSEEIGHVLRGKFHWREMNS